MSKEFLYDEVVLLEGDVEVVEEYLDVSEELIELEKNKDLVRMEMNIIEYPIFSKNKQIKKNQIMKYHFKADGSSFIEVAPKVNSKIPGEFSERVFISLTKIMRNNGYGSTFYTTPGEIKDNLGTEIHAKNIYTQIDEALHRLTETNYKFANTLYSNEERGTIKDEVRTTIMNIRTITYSKATENEKELFYDKRIKRVYKISFTEYFFKNIIQKGYLVFDSDDLLRIKDSVTRSIFTMITKWRNSKLYLKKPLFFIARRIPLKWDKRNLSRTIKRITTSCEELKKLGFIKDYNFVKLKKLDSSEMEFFFTEEHNKIKQKNFYEEKNLNDMYITHVEDRILIDEEIEEELKIILNIFPEKAKALRTLPIAIKKALKVHKYEYVKYAAEYTKINCKLSFLKYFKDCIEKNWHEEYMLKKMSIEEKEKKSIEKKVEKPKEIVKERVDNPSTYEEWLVKAGINDTPHNKKIYEKIQGRVVSSESNKSGIIVIKKKYVDITGIILDMMEALKSKNITCSPEFIQLITVLKRYKGEMNGVNVEIEYIENENSLIKIGG